MIALVALTTFAPAASAARLPRCPSTPAGVGPTVSTPAGTAAAVIKYVKTARHLDVTSVDKTAEERHAPDYTVGVHKCQSIGTGGQVLIDSWKGMLPQGVAVGYVITAFIRPHVVNMKSTLYLTVAKVHGVWRVLAATS